MRFAYNNYIDAITATSLSALSEATGYPVSNIQDQRLSRKWKSDTATTQTVTIDFGSARSITGAAVLSHNIASTATVVLYGNATNVWTAPSVIESLTWNSGIILKFISSASYQYWQFSFTGLTQAVEIGKLYLGDYVDIDPSSTLNFDVELKRDDTVVYGKGRQKYASPGESWRKIDLDFPPSKTTAISVIQTAWNTVGKHTSFIFANFSSLRDYPLVEPMYCSFTEDLRFSHLRNQNYTYAFSIEEDK